MVQIGIIRTDVGVEISKTKNVENRAMLRLRKTDFGFGEGVLMKKTLWMGTKTVLF